MAHTGSLAGSIEAFDAVAGEVGVIRADTLDDAVEITELLVHTGAPPGRRLGAVTLSGAYRGLLLDSAERNGMEFPPLAQCHHGAAERRAHSRVVGQQSDRRRLRGVEQRRQFHGQRRRAAGRPQRRHGAGAGGIAARPRRRPHRALHSPRRRLCRDQSEKADRIRHPDLPWADRLQPRAAGARRRTCRSCRRPTRRCARSRASPGGRSASDLRRMRPRMLERRRRNDARSSSACGQSAAAEPVALDEVESKEALRTYGIATPAEALVEVTRRGDRGRRPHRLPGRAQGGVGGAPAQVGPGRGRPQSGNARGVGGGL